MKKLPRPLKRRWALLVSAVPTSILVYFAYGLTRLYGAQACHGGVSPGDTWFVGLVWAGSGAAFWHGYVLWRGYYDGRDQREGAK